MNGMKGHLELSKFTASGKTFFFNKLQARNGDDYLSINALYGQGNHERITLFEPQLLQFTKHTRAAVEKMTGLSYGDSAPEAPTPVNQIPLRCAKGHTCDEFRVSPAGGERTLVFCLKCGEEF